jgi:ubiquinone biosynthesis protein
MATSDSSSFDISSLVPEAYAAYRPVIADGLWFFVNRLPADRRNAILAEQSTLPAEASVARRLVALMRNCPTLHKLGQVVARHSALSPELRRRLQSLETLAPATPIDTIRETVRVELGSEMPSGFRLGESALAEGSVAVVVPFEWRDGGTVRDGVLKVLKPGVEARLDEELAIWSALGEHLDETCHRYGIPAMDYRETFEQVRDLLRHEVRLDLEQEHLTDAAATFADEPGVHVPALLPFCSPRMTAMERIVGRKVTDAETLSQHDPRRLATTIVRALIASPIWSPAPAATFHADPHAGNLFVDDAGRLVILDWSLTGRLSKPVREQLSQIVLAALMLDGRRVAEIVGVLARTVVDEARMNSTVRDALRRMRPGRPPGFDWLVHLLDELVTGGAVTFPPDLMLFRKTLLTLEGVVEDVSPGMSIDAALFSEAAERFAREWPMRAAAGPFSRDFGTHISNADLWSLGWSAPAVVTRAWMNAWSQYMGGAGPR